MSLIFKIALCPDPTLAWVGLKAGQSGPHYKRRWGLLGVGFGALARTPLWAAKSGLYSGGSDPRDKHRGRRLRAASERQVFGPHNSALQLYRVNASLFSILIVN